MENEETICEETNEEYVILSDEEFNNLECEIYCDDIVENVFDSLGM